MKISRAWLALTTVLFLPALTSADDFLRLTFSGSARYLNERENVAATRLTANHLMARCVGTNNLGTNHPYLLVYNADNDRIQVLNSTNGQIMCDVLEFQNAYVNVNDHRSERLAFVFVPDETNSVGSAMVFEKLEHPPGRILLSGRAQFALASLESESANSRFDDSPETNGSAAVSTTQLTALPAAVASTAAADIGSVPLPPGLPSSSASGSGSGTQTNTVPVGQSPGTLISLPVVTNPGTNSLSSTNVVAVPAVPAVATPGGATNAVSEPTTSQVVSNVVICSGNFAAGRRVRVPNGNGD